MIPPTHKERKSRYPACRTEHSIPYPRHIRLPSWQPTRSSPSKPAAVSSKARKSDRFHSQVTYISTLKMVIIHSNDRVILIKPLIHSPFRSHSLLLAPTVRPIDVTRSRPPHGAGRWLLPPTRQEPIRRGATLANQRPPLCAEVLVFEPTSLLLDAIEVTAQGGHRVVVQPT